MKTFDIKSHLPTQAEAKAELLQILNRYRNERIIKIIHGYGSHGVGGSIKTMVQKTLKMALASNQIADFIPGEATVSLMGYDEIIRKYKQLLQSDSDFKKGNDGITYVIFSA